MEKFNESYQKFLNDLVKYFPRISKHIDFNKENFLSDFIEFNLPYMEDISVKNEDVFKYKYKNACLVRNVKFYKVIEMCKLSSDYNLNFIWKYLHRLYLLAYKTGEIDNIENIVDSHPIIIENIKQNGSFIEKDVEEVEEIVENKKEEKEEKEEKKPTKTKKNKDTDDDPFAGTMLGNLAKELSQEINPEDIEGMEDPSNLFGMLLGGGEGGSKLTNIMEKVCKSLDQKIKSGEVDQGKLFGEAQQMAGNLNLFGNMPGMPNMPPNMGGMPGMPSTQSVSSRQMRRKIKRKKIKRKK